MALDALGILAIGVAMYCALVVICTAPLVLLDLLDRRFR